MTKYLFLIAALCLITASVFSQPLELDINKNKLADFLKIERGLGSTPLANESNYISQNGVAQPIQFERKENIIPNLRCYYFYFQKDSTMSYALYEWDERNFNKDNDSLKISHDEIKAFIDKYKMLCKLVAQAYGESNGEGNLNDLSQIENGIFERSDLWKLNDSTEIKMYIGLSSKYERKGAVTTPCYYRIRLYISHIDGGANSNALKKPDEAKIRELDLVLRTFLSDVQGKNFIKARTNLSVQVNDNVTDQQLDGLRQYLQFKDSLSIYGSEVVLGTDGSSNLAILYHYATDLNKPPKELIKVIFDEDSKIVIVRPIKRQ